MTQLTATDLTPVAHMLAVPTAVIAAVASVESAGTGFSAPGQPVVLFERHWFYRQLKAQLPADQLKALQLHTPDLINPTRGGYRGGQAEYRRFEQAALINRTAAIEATSWGLFQLMGLHWARLGFVDALEFQLAMAESAGQQLAAFGRFILTDSVLHTTLKTRNWAGFARRYNGPAYQANQYDRKLAQAYARHLN